MNLINIILILILQFIFLKSSTAGKIFSFLEAHYVKEQASSSAFKKIEKIDNNVKHSKASTVEDDQICNMTNNEKQTLCSLVFNMKHYKKIGYYMNKTAHYKAKLPCEYNIIKFKYINNDDPLFLIKQKMYPCYGRHEIVMTSFIEDYNYDSLYLSAGHVVNSIAVYLQLLDNYFIIDYIYNVNVLELQYIPITIKEINNELKTMKQIFFANNSDTALSIYETEIFKRERKNIKKDPVCNLEYEKKIALCSIMLNVFKSHNIFKNMELNKIVTYVSDLTCVTEWVTDRIKDTDKILRYKQAMYPCPTRNNLMPFSIEMLDSVYTNLFYISSSPKRNSFYMYFRNVLESKESKFTVLDLIGNFNFKHVESFIITTEEQIAESKSVYLKIQGIISSMEKSLEKQLSFLLLSCENDEQENEKIRQLFYKNDENQLKKDSGKLNAIYQGIEQQSSFSSIISISPECKIQFGPQVYKRLLQKKKLENEKKISLNKELSDPGKKLFKKGIKIIPEINDSIKVRKKVSKMIANMEIIAVKIIQDIFGSNNKQSRMKNNKQKKQKKPNKY